MKVISIKSAVIILNEFLEADPKAIKHLFNYRIPVNQNLVENTGFVPGLIDDDEKNENFDGSILGILNGLFGSSKLRIAKAMEGDRLIKFTVQDNET